MKINNINSNTFQNNSKVMPTNTNRHNSDTKKSNQNESTKINTRDAAINFSKGLISPVTSMFKSPKSFIVASTVIAANTALIVATGGAIAPVLVTIGIATGAAQTLKTVADFTKAKNKTDFNKAFYEAGEASSTLGLSILGAKPALKQAGIITKDLNTVKATAKCFTSTKSSLKSSEMTFKTGIWKECLTEFVKPLTRDRKLYSIAKQINADASKKQPAAMEEIRSILPDDLEYNLTARVKSTPSIYNKIRRKTKSGTKIQNVQDANNTIQDIAGFRIELKNPSKEQTKLLADALTKAAENEKVKILVVENYYSKPESGYFTENQCLDIGLASGIDSYNGSKGSGYTTTQLNIQHKNGLVSELQIRGPIVNELCESEHILYNLRESKNTTDGVLSLKSLFAPLKRETAKLSKEQFKKYNQYINDTFSYSKVIEEGGTSKKPELPEGLSTILKLENVEKLNKIQHEIKKNDSPIKYFVNFSTPNSYFMAYSLSKSNKKQNERA